MGNANTFTTRRPPQTSHTFRNETEGAVVAVGLGRGGVTFGEFFLSGFELFQCASRFLTILAVISSGDGFSVYRRGSA